MDVLERNCYDVLAPLLGAPKHVLDLGGAGSANGLKAGRVGS